MDQIGAGKKSKNSGGSDQKPQSFKQDCDVGSTVSEVVLLNHIRLLAKTKDSQETIRLRFPRQAVMYERPKATDKKLRTLWFQSTKNAKILNPFLRK